MRGSVRETERDGEREGERALGAERGGPGGEGARTAPLGARPGPARLGSHTWARSRCGRCRALAAFLKAADMAAMAAPSAGPGTARAHAGRAPEQAGPGVSGQSPRAPPPGGAVSMATAGTRARPRARPRRDPRAWASMGGPGRHHRRCCRDSPAGRAPPVPSPPPAALPRSRRSRRSRRLGTGLIPLPAARGASRRDRPAAPAAGGGAAPPAARAPCWAGTGPGPPPAPPRAGLRARG